MKVRLAYTIKVDEGLQGGIEEFNTKKAAQMYDRFLKSQYGIKNVHSTIIYDDEYNSRGDHWWVL